MKKEEIIKGVILIDSWGYDQTNIDFYQIIEITKSGKSVKIQRIKCKDITPENSLINSMSGYKIPLNNEFIENEPILTKKIIKSKCDDNYYINNCDIWGGKPEYYSWYA